MIAFDSRGTNVKQEKSPERMTFFIIHYQIFTKSMALLRLGSIIKIQIRLCRRARIATEHQ